jgi:drug/metabolite transporter (DMT)-like permease
MKKEMILLILSGIFYGTVVVGAQFLSNLGMSSYEIAFTTILVPAVLFFVVSVLKKEIIKKKDIKFFIIFGLVNALIELCWISPLSLGISVSIVILLLYTQPIWTVIFSKIFFKEKITKWKIISLIVVLFGVLILVSPWDIRTNLNSMGIIFGVLSGLFYSIFLIMSKETTNRKIHYSTSFFGIYLFTIFWLLIISPFYKTVIKNDILTRLNPSVILENSLSIIVVSLIIRTVPQILLYKAIVKIKISIAGIVLLIEPVVGSILAYFLFNQPITQYVIIGGFLIIFSNYLVIKKNE